MIGRRWFSSMVYVCSAFLFLCSSEPPASRCSDVEPDETGSCRLEARLGNSDRNFRFDGFEFAFFPDAQNFLVIEPGGYSCDVDVWKISVNQLERVKRISKVSATPLMAICPSRTNGTFFCIDWGGTVFRVSVSDGISKEIAFVEGAESIAASQVEDVFAVSGVDGRFRLFDAVTGNLLRISEDRLKDDRGRAREVTYLRFSRDGRIVMGGALSNPVFGIWRSDNAVRMGQCNHEAKGSLVNAILTADGQRVVTTAIVGGEPASVEFRVWSAVTGKLLHTIDPTGPRYEQIGQDLVPEERTFRMKSRDRISSWDVETGKKLSEVKLAAIDGHTKPQAVSPDGRFVLGLSGKRLQAWNAETGAVIGPVLSGHRGPVRDAQVIDQGRVVLAVSNDGIICRWDRAAGQELSQVVSEQLLFGGFAYDPARQEFVVSQSLVKGAGLSESGRFFDLRETTKLDVVRRIEIGSAGDLKKVAVSPNGKLIAACFRQSVAVWDKSNGQRLHDFGFAGGEAVFRGMSFSEDSSRVFIASSRGRCLTFDLKTDQQLDGFSIWEHAAGKIDYPPDQVNYSRTFSGAVNENGTSLVVGFGRWLGVYDLASGQLRSTIQTNEEVDQPYVMALSNDARQLVTAEVQYNECITTDEVILWDLASGKKLASWSTPNARPTAIRFVETEKVLVLGMDNGTIELRALPKPSARVR